MSISRDSTLAGLHRLNHPLYAASTTAMRIVVRDSRLSVSCLELCFFFYSVTDVISNVAKYNTSVKIYLGKSKITDLKNDLKITKYTKKLLNYSNVSKSNSLLYTSAFMSHPNMKTLALISV